MSALNASTVVGTLMATATKTDYASFTGSVPTIKNTASDSLLGTKIYSGKIFIIPGGYSTQGQVIRGTTVTGRKRTRIENDVVEAIPSKINGDGPPSTKVLVRKKPALFKVPLSPAKKIITIGRQQKILQAFKETMGITSTGYAPKIGNTQDGTPGNWIFQRMTDFAKDVEKFKVSVCQLLDPSQVSLAQKNGSWLEALILRSCWYSQKRAEVSREPFTNYSHPVYFDPECNYQIKLRPSGDTSTNAAFLDQMVDFMYMLGRLQLDEMELSLVTAWLLFEDDSFTCSFPDKSGDGECDDTSVKASMLSPPGVQQVNLKKTVHELLYEYQTKAMKNRYITSDDGNTVPMSTTYRTMNVLLAVSELAGISFLMGV